jgi:S-adenosylmethionine decarboxylase
MKSKGQGGRELCQHTLIEFHGCDAEVLGRTSAIRKRVVSAVRAGRGTIVKSLFHQFSPWGVSGVVVITESHVTIHTWPEHGYAAVDIFSCSPKLDHAEILERLREALGARRVRRRSFRRGAVGTRRGAGQRQAMASAAPTSAMVSMG